MENNQRKSSGLVLGKQEEKRGVTQGGENLEARKWSDSLRCGRVVKTDRNRKVDTSFAFLLRGKGEIAVG